MLDQRSIRTATENPRFRYERKFVITHMSRQQIEGRLRVHPAIFREIYSPRFVNNIYLDTPSLKNYRDSIEGATHRLKVRIRWYGDLFGKIAGSRLELKEKVGLLGTKHIAPLDAFVLRSGLTENAVRNWLQRSDLTPATTVDICSMRPVLLNRYARRYWMSRDGRFRITLDWGVMFYRMSGPQYCYFQPRRDDGKLILELKYQREMDPDVATISRHFPCRLSKSSKYVTGVNLLYDFLSGVNTD